MTEQTSPQADYILVYRMNTLRVVYHIGRLATRHQTVITDRRALPINLG